jgi:hypothetical protein
VLDRLQYQQVDVTDIAAISASSAQFSNLAVLVLSQGIAICKWR